jgi:GDPmannose 4,6-dehydratase
VKVLFGDMSEGTDISSALQDAQPDEIYNLASQSRPGVSWFRAPETLMINGMGAIRLFETMRHGFPKARVYHASSSEMFGQTKCIPQNEETPFNPANPYAAAKVYAHQIVRIYRESYGLFIASGILFNHESERRGETFVTRKVTRAATRIKLGLQDALYLGNIDAQRDWGYAKEYVEMMWLMLQQDKPDDYVVATNETHTVREFCQESFGLLGLDWEKYVKYDARYERPAEVELLIGDPAKAKKQLGWEPKVRFKDLVKIMTEHDLELAKREAQIAKLPRL